MKIVIAPDSYKESLSALEVARLVEKGFKEVFPDADFVLLPIADGGEGTVDAMAAATCGIKHRLQVTGPLGELVEGFYGVSGNGRAGFIEMAAAGGLALVPRNLRNPLVTTTRGVGELMLAALDGGVRELIIGIGGSATNDGGAGMLQALGVRLLDANKREIEPGGGGLGSLAAIDASGLDPRLANCKIQAACDVDNPLTGPRGASAVFGPQKGATPAMVKELDRNLEQFGLLLEQHTGGSIIHRPGSGAAGGMGAALLGVLGAELRPGVEIVIEAVQLDKAIAGADLVITGEGKLDGQTAGGKAPAGVAQAAARYNVPVIAIGGCIGSDLVMDSLTGFSAIFAAVSRSCSISVAIEEAEDNLLQTARNVAAAVQLGMRIQASS